MGGGPFYNHNMINTMNNYIPLTEQSQQQQRVDDEHEQRRQQYYTRSTYNPFVHHQPSWSSNSTSASVASVYPSYDPSEFQLDPIPLIAPELPPRPAAYRHTSSEVPSRRTSVYNQTPILQPTTSVQHNNSKVRLVYTKSGFYLKSTNPLEDHNIHGFLAVFSKSMDNVDVLIAWIPEYLIEPHDIVKFIELDGVLASDQGFPSIDLNFGQAETMTIALKNVYSLYVCPPSPSVQGSIVITSRSGDVLKPLWYSASEQASYQTDSATWPGYNIIDILSAFNPLKSSRDMRHVHLVENDTTPFTSPAMTASTMMSVSNNVPESSTLAAVNQPSSDPSSSTAPDPIVKALRDARWTLLERLSRITQYSKDTAVQMLEHPMARPILPLLPPSVQGLSRNYTVQNTLNEYQMASQYLAHWGGDNSNDHYLADDVDGLLHGMPELCGPTPIHTRREPVSPEEWVLFFDDEGKLCVSVDHIRQLVFQGGLDADIRIEAWKFLLGIYPWDSTFNDREAMRRSRAEAYYNIKANWFDHPEIRNTKDFQDEKHRIDKDVHRTDRSQEAFVGENLPNPDPLMAVGTNANLEIMKDILVTYNFHNTELGYVQGMSDLLAPLFVAMGDEAMAFWAFTAFMDRVQSNFFMDQSGMHGQLKTLNSLIHFMDPELYKRLEDTETSNLFFCFRWLLVWFKREFEWEDVIRLWEVLWTDYLSDKIILFIALAVIDAHRKTILEELNQFDEILKYINDLTGNISLEPTLERAEVLFYQFERKVRAMQHKKAMLQEQLEIRSVWNSSERPKIQERIEKLDVPANLLTLLPPPSPPSTPNPTFDSDKKSKIMY
ncbi:trifunctional hydroxymethylpyrimidine kinase/phosphomethylpyrimidine kinase/thiaminase [Mucor velutinosus]|uniref:GTPase-activating protein GYP7 n=1 Tax=Mucor velutinosus TaxID=708070 RepID=A0AAN7D3U4_9FUNG|nr:trifunctional hydroxymethylpyrimidine kinase/phosphomethylpyrimidine kinase/thiaminase [Mucor velutinosus]